MYSIPEAEVENPPQWALDHVGLVTNKIRTWHEQNARCCYCYTKTWLKPFSQKGPALKEATAEHVKPKSKGGLNNYQNIVMACRKCNNERATMDIWEYWELSQEPQKMAAWRKEQAQLLQKNRAISRTRQKKRQRQRLSIDAEASGLTQQAFLDAIESLDMTIWDAHNLTHSRPWNKSLCLLLKLWQPSPTGTARPVLSSKSPLFKIALWLYTSPKSRCQLVTQ